VSYLNFGYHVFLRNKLFSIEMSATLGKDLVFEMKSLSPCDEILENGFGCHFGFAETGVRVGENRKSGTERDFLDSLAEEVQLRDAYIGNPVGGRECCS
jgi:hypothetical protein